MRDYIEERNFREKIKNSIIKRMNVHYMTKEEIEQKNQEEDRERKAREVYEHMVQQAREEEERQREACKREMEERQKQLDQDKASHDSGQEPAKDVTKEQIDAILAEKEDTLHDIIEHTKHEREEE